MATTAIAISSAHDSFSMYTIRCCLKIIIKYAFNWKMAPLSACELDFFCALLFHIGRDMDIFGMQHADTLHSQMGEGENFFQ